MEHVRLQMRIDREVDGRERNIPHQARRRSFVKPNDTQLSDDVDCTFFDLISGRLGGFTLHLQPNLHNLKWVCEYDLASTSGSTGNKLPPELDPTSLWVRRTATNKIIDSQLDRFLGRHTLQTEASVLHRIGSKKQREIGGDRIWTYDKLWSETTIKTQETLVMENLTSTVNAVLVQ